MNNFNRLLAVLVFLVLIVIVIGIIAAMLGFEYEFLNGYLEREIEYLNSLEGWQLVLGTAVAIPLILLLAFLIFLEVRKPDNFRPLLLGSDDSGVITLNRESVEQYAETVGLQIAQVRDIECRVWQTEQGLKIKCRPVLLNGTNVLSQAARIKEHIGHSVSEVTGIPVIGVEIKARYEAPDKQPAEQVL